MLPTCNWFPTWGTACLRLQAGGRGGDRQPRLALLHAIWTLYWQQYLSIGMIKLLGDVLNFAGPFLLQLLLRCAQSFFQNQI